MKINSLKLKDIRTIKKAEIDLSNAKTILITGETGSGKSTILEAIELSLFNSSKSKLEEMIREGEKYLEVSSEVNHGDTTFNQDYKYKDTSSRVLTIKNQDGQYNNSEAVNKLKELYNFDIAKNAIMSMQKSDDITKLKGAECRELLKGIYNSDFSAEEALLDEEIKDIKNNVISDLNTKLAVLNNKTYNFKKPVDTKSEEELKTIKADLDKVNEKLSEIAKLSESIKLKNDLENQVKKFNEDILSKKQVVAKYNKEIDELKAIVLKDRQSEIDKINKKLCVDNSIVESYKKEVSELIVRRLPALDSTLDKLKEEKINLSINIKKLKEDIKLRESGKCPTCGNEFACNETESFVKTLEESEQRLIHLQEAVDKEQLRVDNYNKEVEQNRQNSERKTLLTSKIEAEEKRYNTLKETVSNEVDLKKKEIEKDKENNKALISSKEASIKETEETISSLESQLLTSETKLKEIGEIKVENDTEYKARQKELEDSISLNNANILYNNKVLEDNKELEKEKASDLKETNRLSEEKSKQESVVETKEQAKKILKSSLPNYIIMKSSAKTEHYMNDFFLKAYNGRYEVMIDNQKTGVVFKYKARGADDSTYRSIVNLSGYESSIINIAWIYALAKQANLKMIILDEITAHGSVEMGLKLWDTFRELQNEFEQIFIITHTEEEKEFILNNFQNVVHLNVKKGMIEVKE